MCGDGGQQGFDGVIEGLYGACLHGSESCFELRPCLLDRIEVGRVGRQVEQGSSAGLDPLPYAGDLVGAEVVHHDDVSGSQLRAQHLVQVGEEDLAVGGGLDGHSGDDAVHAQRAQDGEHLPVAAGYVVAHSLASLGAAIEPSHLRRDAAFIQINQVFRSDRPDTCEEGLAAEEVLFRVALGGVQRLFFRHRPSFLSTRHNCVELTG